MKYKLIVEPQAEADVDAAYWTYARKVVGLGDQFMLCIDAAFARAERTPKLFAPIHRDLRRILVRRFPFAVFFVVEKQQVHILAVFHCAVDPAAWQALR